MWGENSATGLFVRALSSITGQRMILPYYHCVSDKPVPHIRHLYHVKDSKTFGNELDFLLKHFQPVSLKDLYDTHVHGKAIRKRSFLISFDDGLRQVNDIIAPLLEKKGVPAVFFVNSEFVDNQDLFFRYKSSLIIDRISDPSFSLPYNKITEIFNFPITSKAQLKSVLLKLSYKNKDLIDQTALQCGVSFENYLENEKPYMSTNQINRLMHKGFDIGAHSMDHPLYAEIPFEEQLSQTLNSIDWVREMFLQHLKTFAFPFTDDGVSLKFFMSLSSKVHLTFGTAGLKKDIAQNNLQRISVESYRVGLPSVLLHQYFKYMIRSVIGKNGIVRI